MAVTEDTTVSIELPDGTKTDPIPLDEFEERTKRAIDGFNASDPFAAKQLSFDVGLPGAEPEFGSVKIGGSFGVNKDLSYGREVRVLVVTLDGEALVDTQVKVTGIAFKKDSHNFTERIHTLG